jgi:uncharacterized protein YwqG
MSVNKRYKIFKKRFKITYCDRAHKYFNIFNDMMENEYKDKETGEVVAFVAFQRLEEKKYDDDIKDKLYYDMRKAAEGDIHSHSLTIFIKKRLPQCYEEIMDKF